MFWHWTGDGLPLPQAKAPLTVARGMTLFRPESHFQGSGSLVLGVGRVVGMGGCIAGVHTPWKNPPPISGVQAYMAYLRGK